MKLFMVLVTIRYPTRMTFNYEAKVATNNQREAIRKLIDFEMIQKTMIFESSAIELEGVVM